MPQEKKGRNPRVSKGAEKPQCHIHDEVYTTGDVYEILDNVCVNAEENNRYEEAAKFRYMAMETNVSNISGREDSGH